jgi:hypothetical protein
MTPEERTQIEVLVKRIEVEKDPETFSNLVRELGVAGSQTKTPEP